MVEMMGVLFWVAVAAVVFVASARVLALLGGSGPQVRRMGREERAARRREDWRRQTGQEDEDE